MSGISYADKNDRELGFRRLEPGNWLDIDPLMNSTVLSTSRLNHYDAWFETVNELKLDRNVPLEIVRLFEATRGMLLYGLFFYPILALSGDQFVRVAEVAARAKCLALGAQLTQVQNFSNAVQWLIKRSGIAPDDQQAWRTIVFLRNDVSHLSEQRAYSVGMLLQQVHGLTSVINRLFQRDDAATP
ncbi:hypothetical protein U0F71_05400 [Burkholderia pseudomallei]|uniref:hypothetical protein n=1 Tax=Burkholderia pseudomallei TaxID=28450 RepID=UPI002AB54B1E|nr:hypothetical protein [Burkholderia pseudomallei]MDY7815154.1 hypothetical protein [Burkholderia pseudomallei]MDY7861715.1 hypothetical protein [Burkholderia pseudomallei]